MSLVVYNTLTREKEPFETLEAGKVRMYVCGPTVYSDAHVGHAMSSIVFDFIRRYLERKGYTVRHVMNFTDVDDKIIARAASQGEDPAALAQRYTEQYKEQLDGLNVRRPTVFPRVSQTIAEIIRMVADLVETDHAYVTPSGDVYFRVGSDPDYGKLSRRRLDEAVSGTRVTASEEKEDEGDFALWKAAKPGEPSWDSPWGEGRPGWHIECSAMNLAFLGEQIDIHGGGNDLIFPHHENEIAQTESYTGKPFARYWMHNGMLQLKGEKMSKSLGNLVTIDEFLSQPRGRRAAAGHCRQRLPEAPGIQRRCGRRRRTRLWSDYARRCARQPGRLRSGRLWTRWPRRYARRPQPSMRRWTTTSTPQAPWLRSSTWCEPSMWRAMRVWETNRSPMPRSPSGG